MFFSSQQKHLRGRTPNKMSLISIYFELLPRKGNRILNMMLLYECVFDIFKTEIRDRTYSGVLLLISFVIFFLLKAHSWTWSQT